MALCRHCGEENPERARFCLACGQPLAHACPACGEENPERARFCLACGTPLGAAPAPAARREVRKRVTIVFCDVAGSTSLGESLDPESLRNAMGRYFDAMRDALERHGGTVEKFIGDAVMAVFGIPVVREDDALRAVRAAADMREARARLNEELQRTYGVSIDARIGVNTGEVVAGDSSEGQRFATGDTVNVAARLEQAATGGEILIGEDTYRLVREAVRVEEVEPLTLKGKSEPVPAYRLLEVLPRAEGVGRRLDAPLVGRARELRRLGEIFARVQADPTCWLVTVLGAAGLGKSRLVHEFVSGLDGVRVLGGRCLPYGEGITFWPVAEIVRSAAGVGEGDSVEEAIAKIGELAPDETARDRVTAAIGLDEGAGSVEETFWGVRRLLETVAEDGPLVLSFDDVHWAEPTLLDLIEYLSGWIRDLPVLVLCQGRPELLESRPGWGTASNAAVIALEPLSADESDDLVEALLGEADLSEPARARIVEAAGGNPLFVEQMLAMLGEGGDGGLVVPPTIQALLAARLDRLDPEERAVLERASVEGNLFHRGAVAELRGADALPQLMTLVRRELIRPARATFPGEDAFSFHHLLIRDAAYESMPKQARAELHERYAGWLERTAGERVREHEEILGFHLEQAFLLRAQLGPADQRALELARRAARRLGSAATSAKARGDAPAVVNLLSRAVALIPEADQERASVLVELGAAEMYVGDLEGARKTLEAAGEAAPDETVSGHARLELLSLRLLSDPSSDQAAMRAEADALRSSFEERGDDLGLLKAWRVLSELHWAALEADETGRCAARAAEYARRAGRRRDELGMLAYQAAVALWGSTPVPEALAVLRDVRAASAGDLDIESTVAINSGPLRAMEGRFDEARELVVRARETFDELGLRIAVASGSQPAGIVELLAGDAPAAERLLRDGYEELERIGETAFLSTCGACLAQAVLEQGRVGEAEAIADRCASLAAPDDVATQILLRQVGARVLARRGQLEEAVRLGREAVELASRTDFLNVRGDAHVDLAEVLELARDTDAARVELERAFELYERKGNLVSAVRVRARLATGIEAAAS